MRKTKEQWEEEAKDHFTVDLKAQGRGDWILELYRKLKKQVTWSTKDVRDSPKRNSRHFSLSLPLSKSLSTHFFEF